RSRRGLSDWRSRPGPRPRYYFTQRWGAAVNALEAVTAAVAARPDDLCVSSLGTATSALRAASGDAPHLYLGGAMGSGLATALGVAERCPDQSVMAILGGGELLMGAGSLWSLAGLSPQNLLVLV